MSDEFSLTRGRITLTAPGNVSTNVFVQKSDFTDVSGYDQFDLQGFLYSLTGGGSVLVSILTSMIPEADLSLWKTVGSMMLTLGAGGEPTSDTLSVPLPVLSATTSATLPVPLLRYVRWKVEFSGGATSAIVEILGLVRRRSL